MHFTPGTRILTSTGYKSIQTISDEDVVFTHNGNWKKMADHQSSSYDGIIVSIHSALSNVILETTANHSFLTKTMISTGFGPNDFKISEKTNWTPASSIKANKHLLCVPIECGEQQLDIKIEVEGVQCVNYDIDWFMVGYYFGKGGRTFEVEFIPPGWSILREFTLSSVGISAGCNHIPEWVQRLPKSDIKTFIRGFENMSKRNQKYIVMNENVAMSIQRLYAKLHRFTRIEVIDNNIFLNEVKDKLVSFDEQYMYVPIEYIFDEHKKTIVYNFEVMDDHSYVVENIATNSR